MGGIQRRDSKDPEEMLLLSVNTNYSKMNN